MASFKKVQEIEEIIDYEEFGEKHVYTKKAILCLCPKFNLSQDHLVGEGVAHDKWWMSHSTAKINHAYAIFSKQFVLLHEA